MRCQDFFKNAPKDNLKHIIHTQKPREERIPPFSPNLQTNLINCPSFSPSFPFINGKSPPGKTSLFSERASMLIQIKNPTRACLGQVGHQCLTIFRGASMSRRQCNYTTNKKLCQIFYLSIDFISGFISSYGKIAEKYYFPSTGKFTTFVFIFYLADELCLPCLSSDKIQLCFLGFRLYFL